MKMENLLALRYKQIGRKIAYYRRLRNLTQDKLAKEVNISASYLSKIERGNYPKSLSLSVLMAIADGLHVDLAALVIFDKRETELQ